MKNLIINMHAWTLIILIISIVNLNIYLECMLEFYYYFCVENIFSYIFISHALNSYNVYVYLETFLYLTCLSFIKLNNLYVVARIFQIQNIGGKNRGGQMQSKKDECSCGCLCKKNHISLVSF